MKTQIIEIDGKKIIVGLDVDGTVTAQLYTSETPPPTGGKPAPAGVKDKVGLSNWLQSQGLKRGSPEYNAKFAELSQGLPLEVFNDKISL